MYIPNLCLLFSRRNMILTSFLMSLNNNPSDDNMATNSPQALITKTDKEIYFYGPLSDESCFRLQYTLEELIKINKHKDREIDLYLQTGGGSVLPTFPIVDLIKSSEVPINTIIKGYCASAGTLISVSGNKRYMTNHSLLLIHSLRQEGNGGNYHDIKDIYDNANTIMDIIKDIYLENTKIPKHLLEYYLDHDLWLPSDVCLKYNIIDEIN